MRLFFYHSTVEILNLMKVQHIGCFDALLSGEVKMKKLKGHVLWLQPSEENIVSLLYLLSSGGLYKLRSITLALDDTDTALRIVKSQFHIIKASGGLVEKNDQLLLIYRHGCWDLPKGKRKPKEAKEVAAKREVEEECGVEVQCEQKIGTTYHLMPPKKDKYSLKKTTWYRMSLINDEHMHPQEEEGIEDVAWFDQKEAQKLLKDSYASIRYIFYLYRLQLAQDALAH